MTSHVSIHIATELLARSVRGNSGTRFPVSLRAGARYPRVTDVATIPPAVPTPKFEEAWKGVIDFAKTVLSIGAALLAAVASLLLVGKYKLEGLGWVPPALLIMSIMLSLYGFGLSIHALRSGLPRGNALLFCNLSVFALI